MRKVSEQKSKEVVFAMTIVDEIMDLFARRGAAAYHGEAVSQTEHALQAADLAARQGATDSLIVAALLHDVGHLLDGQDEDLADHGLDGRHEEAGCAWLAVHFGPRVTEPIRLHVAAKRYLCAVDPGYLAGLSPSSRLSLSLQGGPMEVKERADFEGNPSYHDAVRLRRWDDTAKVPGLTVPGLDHYRDHLTAAVRTSSNEGRASRDGFTPGAS
jgi:[1-hydroxy-2-(trimethylamino)ethyl]phosphonate dioxygenase